MKRFQIFAAALLLVMGLTLTTFAGEANHGQLASLTDKDQELMTNLNNADLSKRVKAAQELSERGVVQAVDPLIDMLHNDDAFQARIIAAMALYELGEEKAFQAIKDQAQSDPRQTVRTALRGICQKIDNSAS